MKHQKEIVGFNFQVIPLEEAQALAAAGTGNYADLKAHILQQIPKLQPDEAFAFGMPKGEVPEDQRRGICMAINSTLKKAKHAWRVTYSGSEKVFILCPYVVRAYRKNGVEPPPTYIPKSKNNDPIAIEKIKELYKNGMAVTAIVKKLNVPRASANYQIYQKAKLSRNKSIPSNFQNILSIASRCWNVPIDAFKGSGFGISPMRKAIQYVAVNKFNIQKSEINKFFEYGEDAVNFNLKHIHDRDKPRIAELEKASEVIKR